MLKGFACLLDVINTAGWAITTQARTLHKQVARVAESTEAAARPHRMKRPGTTFFVPQIHGGPRRLEMMLCSQAARTPEQNASFLLSLVAKQRRSGTEAQMSLFTRTKNNERRKARMLSAGLRRTARCCSCDVFALWALQSTGYQRRRDCQPYFVNFILFVGKNQKMGTIEFCI